MRFRIPGQSVHIRIMEPVTTEDTQYHIFDTGVDYADGSVDSIAIGGAFATVKRLSDRADDASLRKAAKKAKKRAKREADAVEDTTVVATDVTTPDAELITA